MRPNYELYCVFTYKKYRHSNHDCASLKINDTGISVIKFAEWRFLFLVFHEGWVNLDCAFVHRKPLIYFHFMYLSINYVSNNPLCDLMTLTIKLIMTISPIYDYYNNNH